MTHENSSSKFSTLLGNSIKRHAPLFVLGFLGFLMALPIFGILNLQHILYFTRDAEAVYRKEEIDRFVRSFMTSQGLAGAGLVLMAIIGGISVFHFLHSRRQSDFFHALPVSRRKLYAVHITTVFLAAIPAYLINLLLTYVLFAFNSAASAIPVADMLWCSLDLLLVFVLIVALAVLSAVLTGNTIVSLLLCGWLNFGLFAGWESLVAVTNIFYPTGQLLPSPARLILFPMAMLVDNDGRASLLTCLIYFVIGVVLLLLGSRLFRIRRAETAENAMSFQLIQAPLKFFIVTVSGLLLSLMFYGFSRTLLMVYLGFALGAFIVHCVVEIVYDLDFHALFRHLPSLAVYGVLCGVLFYCGTVDITGWNTYLPERSTVVDAELSGGGEDGALDLSPEFSVNNMEIPMQRPQDIYPEWAEKIGTPQLDPSTGEYVYPEGTLGAKLFSKHEVKPFADTDNVDIIYQLAEAAVQQVPENLDDLRNDNGNIIHVTFTTSNGKTFDRRYILEPNKENTALVSKVRYSEEYRTTRTAISSLDKSENTNISLVGISDYVQASQYDGAWISNATEINKLLSTCQQESDALTAEYCETHAPVLVLHTIVGTNEKDKYLFGMKESGFELFDLDITANNMQNVPVYECQTKTLELLKTYLGDKFTTRFGDAKFDSVTVQSQNRDGGYMEDFVYDSAFSSAYSSEYAESVQAKTFTDQQSIETLLKAAAPNEFLRYCHYNMNKTEGWLEVALDDEDDTSLTCTYPEGQTPTLYQKTMNQLFKEKE